MLADEDYKSIRRLRTGAHACHRPIGQRWAAPVIAIAIAVSQGAYAQVPLGAGGAIQQIPPVPGIVAPELVLPIEQRKAPPAPALSGPAFLVNAVHVTGQTFFSEAELVAATNFRPGTEMRLGDLQAMAEKISETYSRDGYFVARAYVPQQDITAGVVTIAVIEGRYGTITLRNQTNVSDNLLNGVLEGMQSGDVVNSAPLERRLLLISDMPGVEVKSTLAPGAEVGTSDLALEVTPKPRLSGSVEASNWGNPYTGRYLMGGTVNLNEPLGIGDVLSMRVLSSTTGGMVYGRLSYQAQVKDWTVGVAYTALKYTLGGVFESVDATGTEQIASAYASYPLIRSYSNNLNAVFNFDYRTFRDTIGITASTIDKHAEVITAGFSGDHHDRFGGGGFTAFYLAGTLGNLDIDSYLARAADAVTARTDGNYAKISGSLSRVQNVYGPLSLYGAIRGQFAGKNLDLSEKMELGGPNAVRAYPEGETYGDNGYVATLEARLLLPDWHEAIPGQVQLIAFVDSGRVSFYKSPWATARNDATRSGAGVGLNWFAPYGFTVNVGYAHKLGDARATSTPDAPGQFWGRIVKFF